MEERNSFEKNDVNNVESILEAASKEKLPRSEKSSEEKKPVATIEEAGILGQSQNVQEIATNTALPVKEEKKTASNDKSFAFREFRKGDIIQVTVVKLEPNGVLVSAGVKEDVFIPLHGLSIKPLSSPEEVVRVGDRIDVYVMRDASAGGSLSLSKKLADYQKKWDELREKYEKEEKVQGVPVKEIKGGLLVDIYGISAFLPQSQIGLKKGESPKDFIGKAIDLFVLEFDKSLKRVVVSRLKVLNEIAEEEKKRALVEIRKGELYEGIVRSIQDFGVFVELSSGLEGLVRLNELTWGRRRPPHEIVRIGEHVKVKVLGVNLDNGKISLSLRQAKPYPWDVVDVKYPLNSVVEGPVIRIHEFGAVVELEDGITGLIHISQLDTKRISKVEEAVKVGEVIKARVISIDKENKKIKLSRRALLEEDLQKE